MRNSTVGQLFTARKPPRHAPQVLTMHLKLYRPVKHDPVARINQWAHRSRYIAALYRNIEIAHTSL